MKGDPLAWPFTQRSWHQGAGDGCVHARGVWETAARVVRGLPFEPGGVDGDLEFLAIVGQHVRGCGQCRQRYRDGRPEDWLWRAVRARPRLRALAEPLQRGAGGAGADG